MELSHCFIFPDDPLIPVPLHYDYFFISKGTEDRAYALFEKYKDTVSFENLVVFDSRLKHESLSSKELDKYNALDNLLPHQETINYHILSTEDSKLGRLLAEKRISKISRAALDISSMNFWEMGDILYYLTRVANTEILDIFYTEPDVYRFQEDDITKYNRNAPKVSFNYPPNYMSTKTTQADEVFVAILGFQRNVLKLMRDLNEVSDWYSINGFPSFYPKAKDISLANNSDYLAEVLAANRFSAEANNPFICFNTLCDIKKSSSDAFMTVCPLGSKPMTLGACLYTLKHQADTRIVYPYDEYVATETDGVGKTYCYRISKDFLS